MGAKVIARTLVIVAIAAPWLVWLPVVRGPGALVVFGAIAIVGALHGWGRLVARLARTSEVDALLAIQWGIAAVIALAGVMIAVHHYDPRLLVITGALAHSLDVATTFRASSDKLARGLDGDELRFWVVPAAVLAVLAIVHVMGAAGQIDGRPFDDDGNVVAQVGRLVDTGALADPVGYPRVSQLGGHVALSGLAAVFTDVRAVRLIDGGLGFVLVLAFALVRIRPRDGATAVWATLVVIAGSAIALTWTDLTPLWIPAGLLIALHTTVVEASTDWRTAIPVAVVAGALGTLRNELVIVALALASSSWWLHRRPLRDDLPRIATLVAGFVVIAAPYVIARTGAWSSVDPSAHALVVVSQGGAIRLVLFALIGAAVVPLLLLPIIELEDRSLRGFAVAAGAGIGAIASKLVGESGYGTRFLLPIAIAGVVVLALAVARRRQLGKVALVLAAAACVVIYEGHEAPGRSSWAWRYYDLLFDVEYARHASREGGGYDRVLAQVPAGDTVAVWVTRPELLDTARNRIVDLRTPRIARLRERVVDGAGPSKLDKLVAATRARWLLVEDDDAYVQRAQSDPFFGFICPPAHRLAEGCTDTLEELAITHRHVATETGVHLVALADR